MVKLSRGEILSKSDCAACQICCRFDDDDLWETPVFSAETLAAAKLLAPTAKFSPLGESFIPVMEKVGGLYSCPMLSADGCLLGEEKPFDCSIWPFRIMNFSGKLAITVSPVCPSLFSKPLTELLAALNDGLAEKIFAAAKKFPDIVKPYSGEPILLVSKD
ncbi:MAG: hypothetical protein RR540_06485 [Oscillospiraceae bacterium]